MPAPVVGGSPNYARRPTLRRDGILPEDLTFAVVKQLLFASFRDALLA
jgi:hypothetical protein